MALDSTLRTLRATADPTRLRLLALVTNGEATVGELVSVLGQSQPRVSRHLKILSDAGLVSRFRDGHSVYYRLSEAVADQQWVRQVIDQAAESEVVLHTDRQGMTQQKKLREGDAMAASRPDMSHWSEVAGGRPGAGALQEQLDEILDAARHDFPGEFNSSSDIGDLLDIGAGSGTLLQLLAGRARSAVGVDTSREMRLLARSRLHQAGLANCTIRDGDIHQLPFADRSFDVVIVDEVLGRSANPQRAIAEAMRVLRHTGRLLILDHILPIAQRLNSETSGSHLFENQLRTLMQEQGVRFEQCVRFVGKSPDYALVVGRRQSVSTHIEPGQIQTSRNRLDQQPVNSEN